MNSRRTVLVSVVVMLIGSTSLLWLVAPDRSAVAGAGLEAILWPEPQPIADFELTTQHGEAFGPESFAGRWSLVFFGYLDCPDVCPMSLGAMRAMQRRLAGQGVAPERLQFVLVSVDSDNDDPARMRGYLEAIAPGFIGLTGSPAMIRRLADSMAVYYTTQGSAREQEAIPRIDHTSSLMIVGPDGRTLGAFQPPLEPSRMAAGLEALFLHHSGMQIAGN
ncbi:MAG: SCO family protein [Wenzhouxiangellaceae bacterium]